jgi:hypothetical protein
MRISPQATVSFLGWFLEFSLENSGIECKALTLLQFGGNSVFSGLWSHRLYNTQPPTYQYLQGEVTKSSRPKDQAPVPAPHKLLSFPSTRPFRFLSRIPFFINERGPSLYRVSAKFHRPHHSTPQVMVSFRTSTFGLLSP